MIEACQHRKWPSLSDLDRRKVRKGFRSPIRKAVEGDPEFAWLHEIADKLEPTVRQRFIEAIERIRASGDDEALRAALQAEDVDATLRALGLDDSLPANLSSALVHPLEDAFLEAARATPGATLGAQLAYRFDIGRPQSLAFLRSYDLGLIRQISDETREAVRTVVADAFAHGGHPYDQARAIRQFIGLTTRQSQAVLNYRDALVEEERPIEQVDRMTERYRQRMLRLRARNIARTTTIDASNAGAQSSWSQAADMQLLNRVTFRQGWGVAPDDRLCVFCAAVPLLNPNGVPLGGLFQTPLGPVRRPTLHPQCRCYLYAMAF